MDFYSVFAILGFIVVAYLLNNRDKLLNGWREKPENDSGDIRKDEKQDFVAVWAQRKAFLKNAADADIADRLQECFDFMRKVLAEADFQASRSKSAQEQVQSHLFAGRGFNEAVSEDQMYTELELRQAALMFFVNKLRLLRNGRITKEAYSKYIAAGGYLFNSLAHQREITKEGFEKIVEACEGGDV